jgi:ATP-binding cassette, subfamily B, bacterial
MKHISSPIQRDQIPSSPLRFLWHVTKPHKKWAILATVVIIIAAVVEQSMSFFFKFIIDAVEAGKPEEAIFYGMLFPVALYISQILWRSTGIIGMQWSLAAKKETYDQLVAYVVDHSHTYFADRFAGSILSKLGNVVGSVEGLIIDYMWSHLSTVVGLTITFVYISMIDQLSGLIFVGLIVTLLVINRLLVPKKYALSLENAEMGTKLRGFIVDIFSNAGVVRQYTMKKAELKAFSSLLHKEVQAHGKSWLYTEFMLIVNATVLFLFALAMFYVLIGRWQSGAIGTGDFVFVIALVTQFTGSLIFIGRAFNDTARAMGQMREGLADLLISHEITDRAGAKILKVTKGEVTFDKVSFAYPTRPMLDNFSLTISGGQRVGLVGQSGAGKSTFISLLLRQYDIKHGTIRIDGQDIAEVTQDSLRANIAVVPQEPLLFHRTIRENIAYGREGATEEEIEEAATRAYAHEFIASLPDGYDTLVGERGIKLSGGQRQRIAIARAMLKQAPILVLDEATSALDSGSEVLIQKALRELMEGKTVVAIAHRLSTLREMDRIIVMERGQIIEDGTHAELIAAGDTYAKLWQHQAGGFLQE